MLSASLARQLVGQQQQNVERERALASSLHEIDIGTWRVLMLVVMLTQIGVSLFFVDI